MHISSLLTLLKPHVSVLSKGVTGGCAWGGVANVDISGYMLHLQTGLLSEDTKKCILGRTL